MLSRELDHPYIDEHNIAGRFVSGDLSREELALFERHYVDCPECMDRVALAQMFRSDAAQQPPPPVAVGLFDVLATFTPRQQTLIFAVSTLLLLLMPVVALTWLGNRSSAAKPEPEPVIWLPASGVVEAHVQSDAPWVSIATSVPDPKGIYRISIVDVADRPLITGPDQIASSGTAIALRLSSLPANASFAIVERKSENGAYTVVSRHSLIINWR